MSNLSIQPQQAVPSEEQLNQKAQELSNKISEVLSVPVILPVSRSETLAQTAAAIKNDMNSLGDLISQAANRSVPESLPGTDTNSVSQNIAQKKTGLASSGELQNQEIRAFEAHTLSEQKPSNTQHKAKETKNAESEVMLDVEIDKIFGEATRAVEQDIKLKEYQLLLPTEYEELRDYLQNDKFLSSEELTRSLMDSRLQRHELDAKLEEKLIERTPDERQKIGDYLWKVHEDVKDVPFEIDPNAKYKVTNFQIRPGSQETEADKRAIQELDREIKDLKNELGVQVISGGFMVNFLHNLRRPKEIRRRIQRLETMKQEKLDPTLDGNTKYSWNQVKGPAEKYGLTKEVLIQSGYMTQFLNGKQTGLMTAEYKNNKIQGYFQYNPESQFLMVKHAQNQLVIPETYLGYKFTDKDKEMLTKEGNMGKLVTLVDQSTNQPFQGYIGVNKDLNRIQVMRESGIKIQDTLFKKELTPDEKINLKNGEKVYLQGLTSKFDNTLFNAFVQIDPVKRSLDVKKVEAAVSIALKNVPDVVKEALKPGNEEQKAALTKSVKENIKKNSKQKQHVSQDQNTKGQSQEGSEVAQTKTSIIVDGTIKRENTTEDTKKIASKEQAPSTTPSKNEEAPVQRVTVEQKTTKKVEEPKQTRKGPRLGH